MGTLAACGLRASSNCCTTPQPAGDGPDKTLAGYYSSLPGAAQHSGGLLSAPSISCPPASGLVYLQNNFAKCEQ